MRYLLVALLAAIIYLGFGLINSPYAATVSESFTLTVRVQPMCRVYDFFVLPVDNQEECDKLQKDYIKALNCLVETPPNGDNSKSLEQVMQCTINF